MDKTYDFTVFIGRFQPVHIGHLSVIKRALEVSEKVIICVGSSRGPRSFRNPFKYKERERMLREACLTIAERDRVLITGIPDYTYDETSWVTNLQTQVQSMLVAHGKGIESPSVALIGHSKDASSYYLNLFPFWGSVDVPAYTNIELLSATKIRKLLYSGFWEQESFAHTLLPETLDYLTTEQAPTLRNFGREQMAYKAYQEQYGKGPFVATDAVVTWNGRILLIRRGKWPGEGLLALPGGFLNHDETLEQGCRRELQEETGLVIPFRPSKVQPFDDPYRSMRGRMITVAHSWHLPGSDTPPFVKGDDDASEALWHPISLLNPDEMFADHIHIIRKMLS